jgi:hypothetical protein
LTIEEAGTIVPFKTFRNDFLMEEAGVTLPKSDLKVILSIEEAAVTVSISPSFPACFRTLETAVIVSLTLWNVFQVCDWLDFGVMEARRLFITFETRDEVSVAAPVRTLYTFFTGATEAHVRVSVELWLHNVPELMIR